MCFASFSEITATFAFQMMLCVICACINEKPYKEKGTSKMKPHMDYTDFKEYEGKSTLLIYLPIFIEFIK